MKARTSRTRNKRNICVNLLLSMLLLISSIPLWQARQQALLQKGHIFYP